VNPAGPLRKGIGAVDRWQRRVPWAGVPYAVVKKFGDDNANLVVVALAWYGFTAVFPLLLVMMTIFGFIGVQAIGTGIIRTLHEFPGNRHQLQPVKPRCAARQHTRADRRPDRPGVRCAGG